MPVESLSFEWNAVILASIAAVISAIYACRSIRIANRALVLAEQEHRDRHGGLVPLFIDRVRWETNEGEKFWAFDCAVSNAAHAPLCVVRADLHLHVIDVDGEASEVILQSTPERTPPIWDFRILDIPLNLETRATTMGWLNYRIPERVLQAPTIDKYELVFVSSSGDRASLEQYCFDASTMPIRHLDGQGVVLIAVEPPTDQDADCGYPVSRQPGGEIERPLLAN